MAIHGNSITSIFDSSFIDNFNASPTYYGGTINTRGQINLIAQSKNIVFQGNKHHVTQVDEAGKALDGTSNAIVTEMDGFLNLVAGQGKKIIFHDSLLAAINNTPLNINPDKISWDNQTGESRDNPWAHNGEIVLMDGITINNFTINLENGSLRVGSNTFIKGGVNARTGTSFLIDGFTTLTNGELIYLKTGEVSAGTSSSYNVTGAEGVHTIRIQMNDNMVAPTNESPVWTFADGSSLKANAGKLVFVLDISNINTRPEELHPFIFSHTQSTEETMASVAGAKNVFLIDDNGWLTEYTPYTVNGITYNHFDFLSGQYGIAIPDGKAPSNVGSAQINTLWTTVKALWNFSANARTNTRYSLQLDRSWAFWVSGIGDYYTQENQSISNGYRYRSLGYAAGGEYTFTPNWTLGVAVGSLWADHDVNGGLGRIDKDSNIGLLYGTCAKSLNKKNTLFFDFQAGYANSRNKGTITIDPIYGDSLHGKWSDKAWLLDLKSVWSHQLKESLAVETFSGLQYTHAGQDDFNLQGNKYGYRLTNGSMNELRATLGSGVRYHGLLVNHAFTAYGRVGIIQDIYRETPRVKVNGVTRTSTALGNKPGRTSINAESGVRIQLVKGWSATLDYSIEVAEKSLMQSARASLIYEF